jgi:hypothetical protein
MSLAVLVTIVLQIVTPHAGRLKGWWIYPILEFLLLIILIARDPGRIDEPTKTVRWLTIGLLIVMTIGLIGNLVVLTLDIFRADYHVPPSALLGRGATLWISNVLVFSLWYWFFDRGGPLGRVTESEAPASFAFPENATPELAPEGWRPQYTDYLYLSFTNCTAFSPTDSLPVRTWAKMTMLIQSVISLVTAILVIARAINVLPG